MHQLYKLGRTLIDAAQRAQGATETGMSASEFVVLRDLFLNGQSSISEIVARTDIAQSRVSVCIKQLVERGWVLTATDPADGRKRLARVTEFVKDEGVRRSLEAGARSARQAEAVRTPAASSRPALISLFRKSLKRVPGVTPVYRRARANRVGLRDPEVV